MQGVLASRGLACARLCRPFATARQPPSSISRTGPRLQRHITMANDAGAQEVAGSSASSEQDAILENFYKHQKDAARLSFADEARVLMDLGRVGVLSTLGSSRASSGFPLGSVVEYAADSNGRPIFALSSRSGHTKDLHADPRCSLTITSPNFQGMADPRLALVGSVQLVSEAEQEEARKTFLQKYPNSYWVDFGDFAMFRMEDIVEGRFNGGFGRAATLSNEDLAAAQPDPIAAFSAPVAKHMNDDHADSTAAMVRHYTGLPADSAEIVDLDRLGMNVKAVWSSESFSVRLPYPRPAEDRKSIKDLIVEMTRAAAKATAQA